MTSCLSLLFLLVMVPAASATNKKKISRPDYARDAGLPDEILTKYEKSSWLYRQLMEKDPYYQKNAKERAFLERAKEIDAGFGRQGGLVQPAVKFELAERRALPHQTRIRLEQPQQAQWARMRGPATIEDKAIQGEEYANRIFAANPYMQYLTEGNPMDPHNLARSAEQKALVGPKDAELAARYDEELTRVVKPLQRQFQPPKPWETYDGFARRTQLIPKRLAPIPFIEDANARREAANKVFGHKNPPAMMYWPQPAPKYLREAENYALANQKHLQILENGAVRAAVNTANSPHLSGFEFSQYPELDELAPRRSQFEKGEMIKDAQRVAEAFKWERIKDKLKDTNKHIAAHFKTAGEHLPAELKRQRQAAWKDFKKMQAYHGRYGPNEMHAERNKLFRREKVSSHPLEMAWLASMLLEKGMAGHWPHIDDKDNRHYGKPSPYAGGPYNPMQSTFAEHGPFRSWKPDRLSSKCIGATFGQKGAEDCFLNGGGGTAVFEADRAHSLAHPAEYQIESGQQFAQEPRDNMRRKWIRAGTAQHEVEQFKEKLWQESEEFHYPQRWSAYRRDDQPPIENKYIQKEVKDTWGAFNWNPLGSKEANPAWSAPVSSVISKLNQATAPRSANWNLQFVQDDEFENPKTIGAWIQSGKNRSKGIRPFETPQPNLQFSPDFPHLDGDLRYPDPSGTGALDNPMAGLVYEVENDLRDPRATYHKTYGTNPHGLHRTDPGIPDIIMEGRLVCFNDYGVKDAQVSLYSGDVHISSAWTDDSGHFKLETTMDFAPHKLGVEIFHQCKESMDEKLDGKGERGRQALPLKYGDRRVYDLGTIDSSDENWHWERIARQVEGVEYQGDGRMPDMAKMRPCLTEDVDCLANNDDDPSLHGAGQPDLASEEAIKVGKNQLRTDRDQLQFYYNQVRH